MRKANEAIHCSCYGFWLRASKGTGANSRAESLWDDLNLGPLRLQGPLLDPLIQRRPIHLVAGNCKHGTDVAQMFLRTALPVKLQLPGEGTVQLLA